MADEIEIKIVDRIAPTIRPKVEQIGAAAAGAQGKIDQLTAAQVRMVQIQSRLELAISRGNQARVASAIANERLAAAEARTAAALARTTTAQNQAAASAARLAKTRSSTATQQSRAGSFARSAVTGGLRGAVQGEIAGLASAGPLGIAAAGATAGAIALGAAWLKYSDEYAGLQNSLKNVTDGISNSGLEMQRLAQIASRTASPIGAVAEGFARYHRTLLPLGKTTDEVLGFTETLNRLLFTYGKTGEESASVTLQLSQAMGKGKLDGDEFRSVMENLPELGTAIARELGVARGELIELAPQGAITADVIFRAMGRAKESVDGLPEPVLRLDAAFTKVNNSLTLLFGSLEQSVGFASTFVGAIDSIAGALDELAQRQQKHNLLGLAGAEKGPNLSTAEGVRKHFALTEEQFVSLRGEVEATARAFDDYRIRNNAGVGSAKSAGKAALRAAENLTKARDKIKAADALAATERDRAASAAAKTALEAEKIAEKPMARRAGGGSVRDAAREAEQFAERRLAMLEQVNRELDAEAATMFLISSEREKQARYSALDERFAGRGGLADEERAVLREKIDLNSKNLEIQREFDAIVDSANGPLERRNAALRANAIALAQGAIQQDRYAQNVRMIARDYAVASDPMLEYTEALAQEIELLGLSAREREVHAVVLARENELREQGLILDRRQVANDVEVLRGMRERRAEEERILGAIDDRRRERALSLDVVANNREGLQSRGQDATARLALAEQSGLDMSGTQTQFEAQAEQSREMYAQIAAMREANVISEREASVTRMRVWQAEQQAKLSLAEGFFGNFTGLMRSENEEIATIGRAAAIAQAIVHTYSAANAAYAAMAGIPVVGPVLGATAAAGAIATGLINVAAIENAPRGFRDGGYTGSMPTGAVAGVVHGQEYVMDAASTSRLGRSNLDALRSGRADIGEGGAQLNLTVVVVTSEEDARAAASGADGEAVIIRTIGKNARQIKRMLNAS